MNTTALSELGRRTTAPPISWLMKLTLDRPELVSLAAGFTDNESLPVAETRALFDELLRAPKSAQATLQHAVLYVPGEICYAEDPARPRPNHEMRINFGGAKLADLRRGVAHLGEALRDCL